MIDKIKKRIDSAYLNHHEFIFAACVGMFVGALLMHTSYRYSLKGMIVHSVEHGYIPDSWIKSIDGSTNSLLLISKGQPDMLLKTIPNS